MILIADSGSTKTDWRLIDEEGKIQQFRTLGFNPQFQTSEDISKELEENLVPHLSLNDREQIDLFFYGAGCSSDLRCATVTAALKHHFSNATIEVHEDLLASARAVCGHEPGIAAILGTGSNSCLYDGKNITDSAVSLGYMLGDEGSGAHIGKTFIKAFLYNEIPKEIADRFFAREQITKEDVLNGIYRQPMPSRYLASFSKFVFQNIKEQYCVDIVYNCFAKFFDHHILRYPKYKEVKMSCVGSVGFYYSNILRAVASDKGVSIDKVIETPIAGLTLYHTEKP